MKIFPFTVLHIPDLTLKLYILYIVLKELCPLRANERTANFSRIFS